MRQIREVIALKTETDFKERQWMNNNGRKAGILWTYCLPSVLAMMPVSVLGYFILVSDAAFEIKAFLVFGCFVGIAAILLAIAREPKALALSDDGLWLKAGIGKTGHEYMIRWENIERFTVSHIFGSISLIAHLADGKKRNLGFMDRQIMRRIVREQKERVR